MQRLKILIIAPIGSAFKTGAGNAILLTKKIIESKHKSYLIDTALGVNENNIRKIDLKRLFFLLKNYLVFLKLIFNSDIVYLTISMSKSGFLRDSIFIFFSKIFKKNIFIHLHGAGFKKYFFNKQNFIFKRYIKFTLNLTNKLFILSKLIKNDFNFIQDKKKIIILPNTIKVSNTKFSKNISKIKIIYLSNFIKSKGYNLVLKTCKLLKQKKIDFECRMFGKFINLNQHEEYNNSLNSKKKFIKFIQKNKLENNIYFNENLREKNKFKILKKSNIFVLPTKYPGEGLPLSLLEAAACKMTLISSPQGAIKDIVYNKINGFIIQKPTPKKILLKILFLRKNKNIFKKMCLNSEIIFYKYFSYQKIKKKILNEFKA